MLKRLFGFGKGKLDRERMEVLTQRRDKLPTLDTRAAIEELSQVVKSDPEAVEIYLALGNLYRSQGEIERAIQIRSSLIVRPGITSKTKARALYELGRDFRRGGFLDRALVSLNDARRLVGDSEDIMSELALLHAERGEYSEAAKLYSKLGFPLAQAHYLTRMAQDRLAGNDESGATRLLKQAVKIYPGSAEAWLERVVLAFRHNRCTKMASLIREGLGKVTPELRFTLLEGLIEAVAVAERENEIDPGSVKTCPIADMKNALLAVLKDESDDPDPLYTYYAARVCLLEGDVDAAEEWLEKTLAIKPDFWLARLELFDLTRQAQALTPMFEDHLGYLMERARSVRLFVCNQCGLKREGLFFQCSRCKSWHSIAFRIEFTQ